MIIFFWTHGAQRNKRKFGCWVVVLFFQQVFKTLEISRKFWFFLTWLFFLGGSIGLQLSPARFS